MFGLTNAERSFHEHRSGDAAILPGSGNSDGGRRTARKQEERNAGV